MPNLLWVLIAVAAGACIAVQGPINAQLARALGLPIAAAAISFGSGALLLAAFTAAASATEAISIAWRAPPLWAYVAGGLLGMVYVVSSIFLVPRIGAAALMGFVVTGQLTAGLLLDRIGFLGIPVHELSLGRVAGVALLVAGVVMIRFL